LKNITRALNIGRRRVSNAAVLCYPRDKLLASRSE
jgi:hypothetical protein